MMNIAKKSGLLSVTFRNKTTAEILQLASQASLGSIEWGGDVHVPPADHDLALEIGRKTREAGMKVSAYGSYYRFEQDPDGNTEKQPAFREVLDTAEALGAPVIRVWAGMEGSQSCPRATRDRIVGRTREVASEAAERSIKIGFEYHGNTLTDEISSAMRFFEEIGHSNVYSFWQPSVGLSQEKRLQDLTEVLPILANVHVFHWGENGGNDRRSLEEGREEWESYVGLIRDSGKDPFFGLEFVKNDSADQFLADAQVLNSII